MFLPCVEEGSELECEMTPLMCVSCLLFLDTDSCASGHRAVPSWWRMRSPFSKTSGGSWWKFGYKTNIGCPGLVLLDKSIFCRRSRWRSWLRWTRSYPLHKPS